MTIIHDGQVKNGHVWDGLVVWHKWFVCMYIYNIIIFVPIKVMYFILS